MTEHSNENNSSTKQKSNWLLYGIACLVIISIGSSAYLLWNNQQQQQILESLTEQINAEKNNTQQLVSLQQVLAQLEQQLLAEQHAVQQLEQKLEQLKPSVLVEVQLLLDKAQQYLQLESSTLSAKALLAQARRLLNSQNIERYKPLITAITSDMTTLDKLKTANRFNLLARFNKLQQQLTRTVRKQLSTEESKPVDTVELSWQEQIKQHLQSLVVIRTKQNNTDALAPNQQQLALNKQLILGLERSKIYLLQKQQVLYKNSINELVKSLTQQSSKKYLSLKNELIKLKDIKVKPVSSSIEKSLAALKKLRDEEKQAQ